MQKIWAILGRPRTISHQIRNRKVSWLELFYDLIFAVVVSRLTDSLLENLTFSSLLNSVLIFAWFIWGWNETSGYFENHGNDSIINVLIINTEMVLTGIGAIFIPQAVAGEFHQIAIVFMLIELFMAGVWFGLAHFDQVHGPASRVWGGVHLLDLVIMGIAFSAGGLILKLGLWLGLLLNIFDVVAANPQLEREYDQADMQHEIKDSMIERYGLMTMIALGEIIAGLYEVIKGEATLSSMAMFIICIIITALVAAIYYQVLGTLHIVLSSSIGTILTGWLFLLGIMFAYYMGVGIQLVWKLFATAQYKWGNLAFAVSLTLFLLVIRIIVIIGIDENKRDQRVISLLLTAEILILLALSFLPTIWFLVGTALVLMAIIGQGRLTISGQGE